MDYKKLKTIFLIRFWVLVIFIFPVEIFALDITSHDFRLSKFRGFHIEGVSDGPRADADINALAKTGANLVRISVFLKRCSDCTTYSLPENDLKTLDLNIKAFAARDIYTYIVLRPAGDERGILWSTNALRQSFISQWSTLALRYKNVASVAAFDLLNEPVPPGRDYDIRQTSWLSFAEELIRAIRSIDSNRVIIVESAPDATPASYNNMRALPFENLVYSFHSYSPFELTHQGVYQGINKRLTYGSQKTDDVSKEDLYKILSNVDNFAKKYDVPIIVGEFSIVRYAPKNSAFNYISDSLEYFEQKGWSWTYHDFRGWPGWDSEIGSDSPNFSIRSDSAPIISLLKRRMQSNKNSH